MQKALAALAPGIESAAETAAALILAARKIGRAAVRR